MNLRNQVNYNVQNAINNQNASYQRVNTSPTNDEFFTLTELRAQSIQASSNKLRNTFFEVPGPWGSTPGPRGTAGSPTVGALQKAPFITSEPYAGV